MGQVVGRLVKEAVTDAPAQHHAHDPHEQDVLDITVGPGTGRFEGREWRMAQAATAQKHEQGEGRQVGQAVPVHSDGANLHGNRVDLRMNKHAGILHAWRGLPRLALLSVRLQCWEII